MILLSSPSASTILDAQRAGAPAVEVSLDLGRTRLELPIDGGRVALPDGRSLEIDALREVVDAPASIFTVVDDALEKVTWFSPETGRVYTLRATVGWPALEISGILMHRIKGTDPEADAASKIAAVAPIRGRVLETCMGLGYSALHAARTADHVTVFEIDPNVVEMARLNPWSAPLFDPAGNVEVREGDISETIVGIPDQAYEVVIHDPPTLAIAGELYATGFHGQLFRVLRPGGRLFHYTGDPGSRYRKQDLPGRVAQRLGEVGFIGIRREPAALGVSARRPVQR